MKRHNGSTSELSTSRSTASRKVVLGISVLLVLAAAGPASAGPVDRFIALLQGGQEVPPTASGSLGNAFMTYAKTTKMLCYSISFTPLDGAEFAAHFHGPAVEGMNASVLFPITPAVSPLGSNKVGCVGPLNNGDEKALRKGLLYINVHSFPPGVPSGEIRGQVVPLK